MARRGRHRKDGPRQPNGRINHPPDRPSEAHLLALGCNPEDRRINCVAQARRIAAGANPKDEKSSTVLGLMLARKLIDRDQYTAGIIYEGNQTRLGKMVGGPNRTRSELASFLADSAPAVYYGIDDDDQGKKSYQRCRVVEAEITARAADHHLLDRIIVDERVPLVWWADFGDNTPVDLATFRADLNMMVRFFERPPRFDDSRRPREKRAATV